MSYVTLAPCAALAGVVEGYWGYKGYQPPHELERVFPTGTVDLLFNLTDGRLRCLDLLSGQVIFEREGPVFGASGIGST